MSSHADKLHLVSLLFDQLREKNKNFLKEIDYTKVAAGLGIANEHTAYCRWNALENQFKSGKLWEEKGATTSKKRGRKPAPSEKKRAAEEATGGAAKKVKVEEKAAEEMYE